MGHSHGKHGAHPAKHAKTAKETGLPDVPVTHAANKVRRSAKNEREPSMAKTVMAVYDIESKVLGRGHYGVVRKCTHKMTGEKCAVKSISKKRISRPEVLKREVGILKAMAHPHIIAIRDVFEDDHHVFIVTELCTGGELFERIIGKTNSEEGHYSEHDAATIVRQVLDAVAYCHKQHVVHRDLKPENFLFSTPSADSTLKIIDFGLARIEELVDKDLDNSGAPVIDMHTRVGTPYYIAPEVLAENGAGYTSACDLWSAGVIFYLLLCGRPPFGADSEDYDAVGVRASRSHHRQPQGGDYGSETSAASKKKKRKRASIEELKQRIQSGHFPLDFGHWLRCSTEACELVVGLLRVNVTTRLTADEALRHAFIRIDAVARTDQEPLGAAALDALARFARTTFFHKRLYTALADTLTTKELRGLRAEFENLDLDRDGYVSVQDLCAALKERGNFNEQLEVEAIVEACDLPGDHFVSYDEFVLASVHRCRFLREDRVDALFRTYLDSTSDEPWITADSLRKHNFDDQVIADVFEACGQTKETGRIDRNEFDTLLRLGRVNVRVEDVRQRKPPAENLLGVPRAFSDQTSRETQHHHHEGRPSQQQRVSFAADTLDNSIRSARSYGGADGSARNLLENESRDSSFAAVAAALGLPSQIPDKEMSFSRRQGRPGLLRHHHDESQSSAAMSVDDDASGNNNTKTAPHQGSASEFKERLEKIGISDKDIRVLSPRVVWTPRHDGPFFSESERHLRDIEDVMDQAEEIDANSTDVLGRRADHSLELIHASHAELDAILKNATDDADKKNAEHKYLNLAERAMRDCKAAAIAYRRDERLTEAINAFRKFKYLRLILESRGVNVDDDDNPERGKHIGGDQAGGGAFAMPPPSDTEVQRSAERVIPRKRRSLAARFLPSTRRFLLKRKR